MKIKDKRIKGYPFWVTFLLRKDYGNNKKELIIFNLLVNMFFNFVNLNLSLILIDITF